MTDLNKLFNLDSRQRKDLTKEDMLEFEKAMKDVLQKVWKNDLIPVLYEHKATFAHLDIMIILFIQGFFKVVKDQHSMLLGSDPDDEVIDPEAYTKAIDTFRDIFHHSYANMQADEIANNLIYHLTKGRGK